jgi:hypothetical protein
VTTTHRLLLLLVAALAPRALAAADAPCGAARLVEGRRATDAPARPKPPKGLAHEEPTFRTCLVRATDHAREGLRGFARNDYSRRQAFNADGTLFFVSSRDGGWHLYDARTLARLRCLEGLSGDAEPQWHPTEPHTLYYLPRNGGLQLRAIDVRTLATRVAADFSGALPWPGAARVWTRSEGSPSRDGRLWALQVETERFEILGLVVWDLAEQRLVGSVPLAVRPDHVSMSPSGRWVVSSGGDGTIAWSPDFRQRRVLQRRTEHSDLAVGADGHDVYVSIDYASGRGWVFMVDLDTGERTDLFPTYVERASTAIHFSGKAYDRPGWVLASTYAGSGPRQWFMAKVFALELRATPRVYPLAAHHSVVRGQYFAEPHATVNRDFTRVLFNSNWGAAGSDDVDAYLIRLPEGAFP